MIYYSPELREKAWKKLQAKGRVGVIDAALILCLHYTTVSTYLDQKKMDYITISNRRYINKAELLRFMEDHNADILKDMKRERF